MLIDVLWVLLRALSFVALFQAAGTVMYVAVFGRILDASMARIKHLGSTAAIAGLALLLAQYSLEAARMAGELSGVLDGSLQRMVLESSASVVLALRLLGVSLIAFGLQRRTDFRIASAIIGAALVVTSFIITGHTSQHPARWMLAPMLLIHLLVVAFWFGALLPLYLVSRHERAGVAARLIDAFSAIAVRLVPAIFAAGLVLAAVLIRSVNVLGQPYGRILVAKAVLFALLMALAAANKWRFGPRIARNESGAAVHFRRAVIVEYVLMLGVLGMTAVLTAFFSPEP